MQRPYQEIWGYKIVAYIFLAGLGAGGFGATAALDLVTGGPTHELTLLGAWVGLLGVGAGGLILLWDLGAPRRFPRLARYKGTLILSTLAGLAVVTIVGGGFVLGASPTLYRILLGVVVLFSLATGAYLGIALAKVKCRPFWNTPMLPLLILVSSLSSGICSLMLLIPTVPLSIAPAGPANLASALPALLGLELLIIALYLMVMDSSLPEARLSAWRLVRGDIAPYFWLGVVCLGILLPLGLTAANLAVSPVLSAALGLVGGVSLCYCLLTAGARSLLPGEAQRAAFVR